MSAVQLGPYVLEEKVAQGGMAEIYKAIDTRDPTAPPVCIKRLLPSLVHDEEFATMFRDEAALAIHLWHDNVVRILEIGQEEDELYLAMELIEGVTLAGALHHLAATKELFGPDRTLAVAIPLCRALHHAHTRQRGGQPLGIVHRDVSPQNILLSTTGDVKLADFGIAKAAQRQSVTRVGALKGKFQYMAPEQVIGGTVDARADQFAAGIVVWEMLTGRRLFAAKSEMLALDMVARPEIVPPSTVRPGVVPRALDKPVVRALSFRAEDRFATMEEFERALVEVRDGLGFDEGRQELATVVQAARAAGGRASQGGAMRTRIVVEDEAEEDDFEVSLTNKRALQSSNRRGLMLALGTGAGVAVLVGAVVGATMLTTSRTDATPKDAGPGPVSRSPAVAKLEALLQSAPGHPCRTERFDDLLYIDELSARGQEVLTTVVTACAQTAVTGAAARDAAVLDPPPLAKRMKTQKQRTQRAKLLVKLADKAVSVGDYDKAAAHLESALKLDPTLVNAHGTLATVYRGIGAAPKAAPHLKWHLYLHPDDAERELKEHWLRRTGEPDPAPVWSERPSAQERAVHAAGLRAARTRALGQGDKQTALRLEAELKALGKGAS